jgi:hypothetical protein
MNHTLISVLGAFGKRKYFSVIAVALLGTGAFAQEVQFDYDRSVNFSAYKTYQWVDRRPVNPGDQLLDQDIKRAVDEQLAGKGLRRVESGGELQVAYLGAISQEKRLDYFATGPGPGWWGDGQATTSTIEVGKLVIEIFDPGVARLIWRGAASKTLDIKKDPEKNYHNLEKAMARLFRNYPPVEGKR